MNRSIRNYLLVHLLLGILIITVLSALANYVLDERAISHHLDQWLSESSLTFQALIGEDLSNRDLKHIQQLINTIPLQSQNIFQGQQSQANTFEGKFQFQVWDKQDHLLLHTKDAPKIPLANTPQGFSEQAINGKPWRVFTLYNEKTGLRIVTAERLDIRHQLGHKIAFDAFYILLISMPVLGILIWFIAGRGLYSIKKVAKEVGHRAPNFLEPVDLKVVPHEVKPLIDELNKLFVRLQQGFEREKSFSANAAHELRTPLAALKTQAQVAQLAKTDNERIASLKKLIAGVDRATHVVQQLLTLSRLVPDSALSDFTKVNLNNIITTVIADIVPTALEKNIEIEFVGGEKNYSIFGTATALSILVRNLIDNAIRYTPENSLIQVKLEASVEHILLKVIDNGPGIAEELRSQVFERFYRILGTKSPGSGLGLAIVQQIADSHHAEVILGENSQGQGLEVCVKFPNF